MIELSFTKFLDFIAKTGEPKATAAISAWTQSNQPYNPATDYHRQVRMKLIEFSKTGENIDWDSFIEEQNSKKQQNYEDTINNFLKWHKRYENVSWTTPPKEKISGGHFTIRVNPELGLVIDQQKYAIKLHINKTKISKIKAQMGGLIMHDAFSAAHPDMKFAILDVKANQFHSFDDFSDKLKLLKLGEMAHLSTMLQNLRNP